MIYTFGHSILSKEAAANMLRFANIDVLIDVRSHPHSRWPQFDREFMECWVNEAGIDYEWWPELGGWDVRHAEDQQLRERMLAKGVDLAAYSKGKFPKQRIAKGRQSDEPSLLPAWTNQGLYDYSFFMQLPEFLEAAELLVARGAVENVAIMCCEVLWWACHRSMIADYLAWAGVEAVHLQPRVTPHTQVLGNRIERYDPEIVGAWRNYAERDPSGKA